MAKVFNYTPDIDFEKHIFWQYNNAPNLNALINQKQQWYLTNHSQFWSDWIEDVLDLSTANDYGLAIWGLLLQVPRTYVVNGESLTLTTTSYRAVLKARLRLQSMRGTVPEINKLLKDLFGNYGKAYVIDNHDMTMTYHFDFNLTDLQITVLQNVTLLPRPAGVEILIVALGEDVFGFNGSEALPFNQAPFATYIRGL